MRMKKSSVHEIRRSYARVWIAESLVIFGVPVSILPCVKGRVGDWQGEGVRSGASRAVTRPAHVKAVEPAPLAIGGRVIRSRSQGGFCDWLPRAWYVNSNPFNSCISRATHDVVLKVAREGPSLGAKCRIEHNSLYETKEVCESMDMEIAQLKTRQPKHKQQANRTIFSLRRFCVTSLLPLMTGASAMKVPRLTSHARRKTLPHGVEKHGSNVCIL